MIFPSLYITYRSRDIFRNNFPSFLGVNLIAAVFVWFSLVPHLKNFGHVTPTLPVCLSPYTPTLSTPTYDDDDDDDDDEYGN